MVSKKKTDKELQEASTSRLMNAINLWCGYYRENPSRFIEDIIPDFHLRWFQKVVLWAMAHNDMQYTVASRGLGKTYIVGIYAIYKCILFPGTRFVTASKTFRQGKEILLKITDDLMHRSAFLRNEILSFSPGQNDCYIKFKNGQIIKVTVAGETGRGQRQTVICVDEARLVEQKVVDTILRPMNAQPRQPGYLNKTEYKYLADKEVPQELYLSSAYYCQSEMYEKVKSYAANMLTPGLKYFICDLPYQLSIKEGILLRQTIENEMSEATFQDIIFTMEREGMFFGAAEDALFNYKTLSDRRVVTECIHDLDFYRLTNTKVPDKKNGEIRVLSVDIALLASKKHDNDSQSLQIHCGLPTSSNDYIDNITFIDSAEGLTSQELQLIIARYYYQYDCDYISIDANGLGTSIIDLLQADMFDPLYGITYPALNVMNNADLAERCKIKNAPKVIYAIKGNAKSNNDMTLALRAGFQNGYINLLIGDDICEDQLSKIKGYSKLTDIQQAKLKMPYVQTTLLINELINLTYETSNNLVKVKEKTGMRKDRFSACEYGWALIQELSKNLKPKTSTDDLLTKLTAQIRPSSLLKK